MLEDLMNKLENIVLEMRLGKIPNLEDVDKISNDFTQLDRVSSDDWVKFIKLLQYVYKEHDRLTDTQNKIEEMK